MKGIDDVQQRAFRDRGVVKLPGLIPRRTLAPAQEMVYAKLAQAGALRQNAGNIEPAQLKQLRKACANAKAFQNLLTPAVLSVAQELVADATRAMTPKMQLLYTPPNAATWHVPHNIWHLDTPRLGSEAPPGVQVFAFLDDVPPQGGGTLVVAGSHRLLNDHGFVSSKSVKRRLGRESFFRSLMDAHAPDRECFLTRQGNVGGVPVQVVELHGEAGDVYFADLRLLHTLAPNATPRPRLMVTQRLLGESAWKRLHEAFDALRKSRNQRGAANGGSNDDRTCNPPRESG